MGDNQFPYEVIIPNHAVDEYDDDRYRLTHEAVEWIVEMVEKPFKIKYAYWNGRNRILFMSKQDAMAFKLAWTA